MPRIGEPRAQHALVAGDDRRAAVIRLDVRDEREARRQPRPSASRSAKYRWLTRMETCITSGGRSMNAGVDAAEQRHRPFDQARQPRRAGRHRRPPPGPAPPRAARCRSAITARRSAASAITRRARSFSCQSSTRRDRERAGGEEAVALGQVALSKPVAVILALAQIEAHHLAVEQADDAAQRAHPGELRWCRPSASISATGSGAAARGIACAIRRRGRDRGCRFLQHPEVALASQLVARRAVLAQEARRSPAPARWRAGRVRCCGARRRRRRLRPRAAIRRGP